MDVHNGFAIYNMIRKPLMMVRGVKILSFCGPVGLVFFIHREIEKEREIQRKCKEREGEREIQIGRERERERKIMLVR